MTGCSGLDWFFFNSTQDRVTDLQDEAFQNDLGFINGYAHGFTNRECQRADACRPLGRAHSPLARSVLLQAWFYGDAGDAGLFGGGPSIVLGGVGDDQLIGGIARDLMIGASAPTTSWACPTTTSSSADSPL